MNLTANGEGPDRRAPDGSAIPSLANLAPTATRIEAALEAGDYDTAAAELDALTQGELLALWVAPSRGGLFSPHIWRLLAPGGAFREWRHAGRR